MSTEDKLMKLKAQIEKQKTKKQEAEAEMKVLSKTLNDDYGLESIEDAEEELKKLKVKCEEEEEKIKKGLEDIEEKYLS